MRVIGVIPVRLGSTRLAEKPLQEIQGKLLVQRVYEQARQVKRLSRIIIACDDQKIKKACEKFGAEVIMTNKKCRSGTERVAEVARVISGDVFVNIQGDEPLINPRTIEQVVSLFSDRNVQMGTAIYKITEGHQLSDPAVVKVIVGLAGQALYFSRSLIPYPRCREEKVDFFKHIGLYGYRRSFLLQLARLKPTPLEKIESLEQLRVLEYGFTIKTVVTPYDSVGVDTPEDLERVRQMVRRSSE